MPLSVFREWRTSDRLAAVALEQYEAMLCGGCGHPMHESMDIENDGLWKSPEPMRCHACTAIQERVKATVTETTRAPQALKFHAELLPKAQ